MVSISQPCFFLFLKLISYRSDLSQPESANFRLVVRLFVTQTGAPDDEKGEVPPYSGGAKYKSVLDGWERGRMQLDRVFSRFRERGDQAQSNTNIGVYACGPPGMVQDVCGLCRTYSSCGGFRFDLHTERFEL